MTVDQLMKKDPVCCTPTDSLDSAARVMWEHDCGFVPVVDSHENRRLVGVITDRDVCMAAYTRGQDLGSLRIQDSMSSEVASCHPGDSIADAQSRMQSAQVRRLPVVNALDELVGVISLADLAQVGSSASARSKGRKRAPTDLEIVAVLGAITAPRHSESVATA